jgi:hypothetical protein
LCHDALVHGRRTGFGIVAALAVALSAAGASLAGAAEAEQPDVYATITGGPAGQAMGPGFVGLSLEYPAVRAYTGSNPKRINPVLVQLVRQLAPSQSPVLRIGGNSTDSTWWPMSGTIPPGGVSYPLTPAWMRTTRALAVALKARLIMGINLAAARPALAAAEGRALVSGLGAGNIAALEIGNEPDLYITSPWFRDRTGQPSFNRPQFSSLSSLTGDFSHWRAVLPSLPIAGPTVATLTWLPSLSGFLAAERGISLVTIHRYPLRGCSTNPQDPLYASITNLLSDQSSSGLAQAIAPYVAAAHAGGVPFRVDELNSAACSGKPGVSNTFASALWALDTLFNLASVGVDGVNIHTLPRAPYEPFTFSQTRGGSWRAFVHPLYYGLLMFAQAFPPGAQLLPVSSSAGPVKIWATQATNGTVRVVIINKDSAAHTVQLQEPGIAGATTLEWLQAPSVGATRGVTFGGQTFGTSTATGRFGGQPDLIPIFSLLDSYTITLPPASAVLLTQ